MNTISFMAYALKGLAINELFGLCVWRTSARPFLVSDTVPSTQPTGQLRIGH
jgi:hypothetical protein